MAEVVDSIIAQLEVRYAQYESGFKAATKVVDDHTAALNRLAEAEAGTDSATSRASTSRKRASDSEGAATKKAAAEVKAAVKDRANAERDAAKLAADATKAAERDKQAALKATAKEAAAAATAAAARAEAEKAAAAAVVAAAEREAAARARLSEVAQRAVDRQAAGIPRGTRGRIGATVPRTGSFVPPSIVPTVAADTSAAAEVAAEKEINHALADRFDLQARAAVLRGAEKRSVQDEISYLARIDVYKRAGLADDVAILRAQREIAGVEAGRAATARKQALSGAARFAEGAGIGRSGGSTAAVAGIAAAVVIGSVTAAAKEGLEYAESLKQVSDQLGLTTHDLQIWQTAAAQAGLKTDQFREAFGKLSENLGKAQLGDATAQKLFGSKNGLNIDIGNAKDGYKSLSDVLPTLINRLSQIPDKQQRIAIETAYGGEQFAKLDPILSGGAVAFEKIAAGIEQTGGALSDKQIQDAANTAKKLSLLNDQLQRDLSATVSTNAAAIETLATAYYRAAAGGLKFLAAQTNQGNLDILNHRGIVSAASLVTGAKPADTARHAFDDLLANPAGRASLLARNTQTLNALNTANQGQGLDFTAPDLDNVADNPQARYAAHQKAIAERARILQADRAAALADKPAPTPVQSGKPGDTSHLFTPKPPKGKTAAQIDAEEQARTKQFQDELSSLQDQALRAQESMTGDIQKQADIEKQIADQQLRKLIGDPSKGVKGDIDLEAQRNIDRGENADLAHSRAQQLKNAAQIAHDTEAQVRDQQKAADLAQATLEHAQTKLSIDAEDLNSRLSLAQTAKERFAIELELLKNAQDQKRNDLNKQLAGLKPGDPRIADVQAKIAALPAQGAAQEAEIKKRDQGPGQSYLDSLPTTAAKADEAFQNAAVGGLQAFDQKLADSVSNALHLHGVLGDVLESIIKIGLERAIIAPIANSLFGAAGGTGGVVGSIASKLFGHATGGPVVPGQDYLVGEKGPEVVRFGGTGNVYPNGVSPNVSATGRGDTIVHQTINIDGRNSVTPESFARQILDQSAQQAALAGQTAFAAGQQVQRSAGRPRLPGSFG